MSGETLPAPDVYDIDGFENSAATVAALHAMGKKVICYMEAGAYETYRPDVATFKALSPQIWGAADAGWPGSYWLDIRRIDELAPIMKARFQMCKEKGFDAIEPDEISGLEQRFGLPADLRRPDRVQPRGRGLGARDRHEHRPQGRSSSRRTTSSATSTGRSTRSVTSTTNATGSATRAAEPTARTTPASSSSRRPARPSGSPSTRATATPAGAPSAPTRRATTTTLRCTSWDCRTTGRASPAARAGSGACPTLLRTGFKTWRGVRASRIACGLVVGRWRRRRVLDGSPDNQTCGDPVPAQRAERAQGLRGSGSRLSKGFQPDLRAGIHSARFEPPDRERDFETSS